MSHPAYRVSVQELVRLIQAQVLDGGIESLLLRWREVVYQEVDRAWLAHSLPGEASRAGDGRLLERLLGFHCRMHRPPVPPSAAELLPSIVVGLATSVPGHQVQR